MTTYQGDSTSTVPAFKGDTTFTTPAVKATNTNTGACNAITANAQGTGSAVYAENSNANGYGVAARNTSTSGAGSGCGILGESYNSGLPGVQGTSGGTGVYGTGAIGVSGYTSVGYGVYGYAASAYTYGVYGDCGNANAYAGFFQGRVQVNGYLSKPGGGFLIDHPLDPTNKDLVHSFVESPEMKNVYDGEGTSNATGELIVQMPTYFEALNTEFRYQLTPIGAPAPDLHVKEELKGGQFVIAGAKPGQKVCWQITGNRKDAWAIANAISVEAEKRAEDKGLYRHPLAHGQPEVMGIDHKRRAAGPASPKKP